MRIYRLVLTVFLLGVVLSMPALNAQQGRQQFGQRQPGGDAYGTNLAGDVTFEYDEETGSLIVITDEATNEQIQKILKGLDRPVPQVLINVLFLEVTHSKGLDLGAEGFWNKGTGMDTSLLTTIFPGASPSGAFYQLLGQDLGITLNAMSSFDKAEILSRPSILVRNNSEAVITIGEEVPFIRNSRITQDGQSINTVEYEDVGIILRVTPHITASRLVEMEVIPEISKLKLNSNIQISETVSAPVFTKRSAETHVIVPDGRTVVIGGLMEDQMDENVTKVPILGDIPLIGMAFRRKKKTKVKRELLIFLTPHVIENIAELESVSAIERDKAKLANEVFPKETMNRFLDDADD